MINPHVQPQVTKFEQPQQIEETCQKAATRISWWRALSRYGYALLIVAAFTGITVLGEHLLAFYYFPSSASLLVAILCVALFWGVGPGLLATFLSCIVLFYFYLAPVQKASPPATTPLNWEVAFPILLFALAGLAVVLLTRQREAARRRALLAEQVAQAQASHLGRTNQELLRANQLKDLFVSVASHELKTPITTIRGQAQLALRRMDRATNAPVDLHSLRETLVRVDEQTKRVVTLLNELLDLTSLRSGKQRLGRETCDLNEICAGAIEEQRLLSKRTIELEQPAFPVLLQADPRRLGQVVTNLVNNALKYSPQESIVSVKIECCKRNACFYVRDKGRGISPEHLTDIFEPFYRTLEARNSTISGTGLGLAICKDIVEQHQGQIWCESQLDAGSTFFVELPLSQVPEA